MPPEVRKAYDQVIQQLGDADHDGIPDILQRGTAANLIGSIKQTRTTITVNGRTYEGPDQMPPDVRQLYQRAMASAGASAGPGAGAAQTGGAEIRTRVVTKAGDRTWTIQVSGRQLAMLGLLVLVAIGLVVLFSSGWHR